MKILISEAWLNLKKLNIYVRALARACRESRDSTRTATAAAMAVCFVGLHRLYFEPRAGSSYLMAVVAIMKRCRDRHLQLSSTASVSSNFCLSIVDSSTLIFY